VRTRALLAELQRRNVHRAAVFYAGAAWLLVQIATQVFPFFHIAESVVRGIVVALAVGFPFAMLFSWFYEWTPQGIRRESDIVRSDSASRGNVRKLDQAIIAVLALAVAMLLLNQFVLHRFLPSPPSATPDATTDKSIAVLPLANSTGDPTNEYFSDGVSEELISSLSRLGHLKVIARTSSFQFKGTSADSRTIGDKLGVGFLLEGSVRKSSDRVRIAVALVKSADGTTVWSESYDRDMQDIFAVQSEIAGAVASALKVALLDGNAQAVAAATSATPSNGNVEAYNALLQGNFYLARSTIESVRKAIDCFREAIRLDPDYALAYAQLASTNVVIITYFNSADAAERSSLIANARAASDRALALQPNLAEAHIARAMVQGGIDLDMQGANAEIERAAQLAPQNPTAVLMQGFHLANRGRIDEALAIARHAQQLDPLTIAPPGLLEKLYVTLGRYDDAEAQMRIIEDLQPQTAQIATRRVEIQVLRGQTTGLVDLANTETNLFWRSYALALAWQAQGDRTKADAQLQTLIEQYRDTAAFQIATVYGLRGDADKVFEWLKQAQDMHDPGIGSLWTSPILLRYRDDPRFTEFCSKLGLPTPAEVAGPRDSR
jgi:TolB-like protein/Tfp pilus assembly protein PilF